VEAELSLEHSDRFDLVGDNLDDPHRVGWLASNYISFVHDNALWLPTGPIDGDRVNITAGVSNDLSNGRFDAWSVAGDLRQYLRIGRESAVALRFLGYYADGSRPRQLSIGGTWGLRGYPRIGGVTGTRALLVNTELRFPIADFVSIGFPFGELRFPGLQGAFFGDLGAAGTAFTGQRGILGSGGLGLRMPLGVLVLRLDLGYRFDFGGVAGYPLTPTDGRKFVDFFFGYNY
jgi:hemolysin activation/secretion protein